MRTASTLYGTIRAVNTSWYEWQILQNENIYGLDSIKSLSVSYALTSEDGVNVGNANSAKCEATLLESSANWTRMAAFTVQFRICLGSSGTKSEWITLGKFYTDTRSEDKLGNLTIVGYDKMLMMEQTWSDKVPENLLPASYPITAQAWATMIQSAGLATFVDLTQLDNTVAFVGLNTTSTIRDVLKDIAAIHAGNWVVTCSTEQLNLVQFENVTSSDTSKFTDLGLNTQDFDDSPALDAVTGVHLETESGTIVEYGTDVGYRLKVLCAFSTTNGVAELCLSKITGYAYKPFEAKTAYLDPISEIGDSVMVDNNLYQIMSIDWTLGKDPTANVKAPYDQEIDHEYTMLSPDAKNYRKTLSMVNEQMDGYVPWDEFSTAIEQNEQAITLVASHTFVSQTDYNAQIAEIQSQIDGSIQTWSGNVVPTLNNSPAVDWTTTAEKAQHVGDTYFVNSDAGIAEAGNYYRFEVSNGTYGWVLLNDTALTEALAKAAAAQAAAESAQSAATAASTEAQSKGKIFVVQPTPPYNVGDLWFNNTESVIKVCMTARESGSYVSTDWVKRDNYADGSEFEAFLATYQETINALRNQIDQKAETYYQSSDPIIDWGIRPVGIAIAGIDVVGASANIGNQHIGDLWYNTSDNTTWYWSGTKWEQQEVPEEVFDKIDGKAQIFISEPYAPYNVGDLWFNSSTSDIMTCVNARTESGFVESDWQKRNKYTDDTATNALRETVTAQFEVQSDAINARVTRTGGNNSSFGWTLTDTSHTWFSGNQEVMKVNSSGLSIKGAITATSGYIGNGSNGFTISATAIRNGMTALSDISHNGIYIGTDGIALGAGNFKVTSGGVITAKSGTVGGFTITANSLYTNGQSSYGGTGSGIYIGSGGLRIGSGFKVDNSGNLTASTGTFSGNVYASNIQYGGNYGTFNGAGITSGTISGGGSGGQIAPYTLTDYNVGRVYSGGTTYGAFTNSAFSSGVNTSLNGGYSFSLATAQGTSNYPSLFKAGYITAAETFTGRDITVSPSGTEITLGGHYHSIIVDDNTGKVTLGKPYNSNTAPSFNVADTKTYRDAVSAVTIASRAVLYCNSSYYNDYTYDCDMTGSSYNYTPSGSSVQYGRVAVRNSAGTNLAILRVKLPAGSSVSSIVLGDYGSSATVFPYYHQTSTTGTIKAVAEGSNGNTLKSADLDITELVQYIYDLGGGGGGGGTDYQLYCVSRTENSAGLVTCDFSISSYNGLPWRANNYYTFNYG